MKKNSILFSLFILLLGVTYVFQEKRIESEHREALTRDHLISGEIKQMRMNDVLMTKEGEKWRAGKTLLSHNSLKLLEKKLKEVKKIKDITGEWQSYFPKPFSVEVNNQTYTFGEMSLDKQAFYVAVDKKIMLAVIEGENAELTSDETKMAGIKYNELLTLLNKDLSELKENQLFRFYPKLPADKVLVKMEGNLEFELDLQKNLTSPPPIKGIVHQEKIQQKFLTLLTQATIKEELDYAETGPKFKQLGMIRFSNEGDFLEWELWLRSKTSADAILLDHKNKKAFLMVGGTLKLFFVHVQDFWDKKILSPDKFKSFEKLTLTFSQGEKSDQVLIINAEPLRIEAQKFRVHPEKMNLLISYLFNLGNFDQADRVSLLSQSERKQFLSGDHLKIEVLGDELLLINKGQELIVANLTQGFKAHFLLTDKSLDFNFKDVLE